MNGNILVPCYICCCKNPAKQFRRLQTQFSYRDCTDQFDVIFVAARQRYGKPFTVQVHNAADINGSGKNRIQVHQKPACHLIGDLNIFGYLHRRGCLQQHRLVLEVGLAGKIQLTVIDSRRKRRNRQQPFFHLDVNFGRLEN